MTRTASLIATGIRRPERIVTNAELRERFAAIGKAELIERFEQTSGIRQRAYAPDDWSTSDLALPAARQALARAGCSADELDLVIVGTDTPDQITPATSVRLQAKPGATRAGTFDIGCACAAFPTAIATAAGIIATNPDIRRVLVVGAYLMHGFADPMDPMIFFNGDGAGAVLLEASDEPGFLAAAFHADGQYADHWGIAAGGTIEPASAAAIAAGRTQVRVQERYPADINEQGWPDLVRTVLARAGESIDAVALAVFTQLNRATIEHVGAVLGLPRERAITIMEDHGYTGSACIPMALDRALAEGRAGPGDLVVLLGAGVGYNMAAVALRIDDKLVQQQSP